jgi:hypothetical protein
MTHALLFSPRQRITALCIVLAGLLSGCANNYGTSASGSSNNTGSGITVFGEIDANVTRSR